MNNIEVKELYRHSTVYKQGNFNQLACVIDGSVVDGDGGGASDVFGALRQVVEWELGVDFAVGRHHINRSTSLFFNTLSTLCVTL